MKKQKKKLYSSTSFSRGFYQRSFSSVTFNLACQGVLVVISINQHHILQVLKYSIGKGHFLLNFMKRRNSLFPFSSGSGFSDSEGIEIAAEMAPSEALRLSSDLITEHVIMSE